MFVSSGTILGQVRHHRHPFYSIVVGIGILTHAHVVVSRVISDQRTVACQAARLAEAAARSVRRCFEARASQTFLWTL